MSTDDKDKTIAKLSRAVVSLALVILLLLSVLGYIFYTGRHKQVANDGVADAWCGTVEPQRDAETDRQSAERFKKLYNVAVDIKVGGKLFKQNCSACHKLPNTCIGPGMGLEGVFDRAPSVDWVYHFILNPDSLIKTGDPYANKIFQEYGNRPMPAFTYLKREEIINIMAYIDAGPPEPPGSVAIP